MHGRVIIVFHRSIPIAIPLRLENNLDAVVHLVIENVVTMRCFFKRQPVCYDEARIDLAILDQLATAVACSVARAPDLF